MFKQSQDLEECTEVHILLENKKTSRNVTLMPEKVITFFCTLIRVNHHYRLFSSSIQKCRFHSIFNSTQKITCSHHVAFNPILLARSALDLLHFIRYFQRN